MRLMPFRTRAGRPGRQHFGVCCGAFRLHEVISAADPQDIRIQESATHLARSAGQQRHLGQRRSGRGSERFQVAFYVGLKDRYDINSIGYGLPVFHRGFRTGWWGWPRGYDVWAVPYTESTVIVDVIDAHTNQLVWRGYDTNTLNIGEPGKDPYESRG